MENQEEVSWDDDDFEPEVIIDISKGIVSTLKLEEEINPITESNSFPEQFGPRTVEVKYPSGISLINKYITIQGATVDMTMDQLCNSGIMKEMTKPLTTTEKKELTGYGLSVKPGHLRFTNIIKGIIKTNRRYKIDRSEGGVHLSYKVTSKVSTKLFSTIETLFDEYLKIPINKRYFYKGEDLFIRLHDNLMFSLITDDNINSIFPTITMLRLLKNRDSELLEFLKTFDEGNKKVPAPLVYKPTLAPAQEPVPTPVCIALESVPLEEVDEWDKPGFMDEPI